MITTALLEGVAADGSTEAGWPCAAAAGLDVGAADEAARCPHCPQNAPANGAPQLVQNSGMGTLG
jgi:hypothetical protein